MSTENKIRIENTTEGDESLLIAGSFELFHPMGYLLGTIESEDITSMVLCSGWAIEVDDINAVEVIR